MKFEDVHRRWQQRRVSQVEAAEILGMRERTFRRWRERYDAEGARACSIDDSGRRQPDGRRSTR